VLTQRLGGLDAKAIAAAGPDALTAAFVEKPALHRFPGSMATLLGWLDRQRRRVPF
jgi:hypothetical protein